MLKNHAICAQSFSKSNRGLWKYHFVLNEIKTLSSWIDVQFVHVLPLPNAIADVLAKQGVDCLSPFVVFHL